MLTKQRSQMWVKPKKSKVTGMVKKAVGFPRDACDRQGLAMSA
jgi:hypothetical protein